ncbi:MAG TPA: hypothetical protein VHE83_15410 [Mycobacteriales bacterium]|nr:hypothetical protein [Mycobacteriales bacterium]
MAGIPALPVPPSLARTALIGLRGSLGAGWFAPQKMAKVFGLDEIDGTSEYLLRLFAVRDTALAALLATSSSEQRALHIKVGIAVDSIDTVAGAIALVTRKVPARAALLATLTAAAAAALGASALAGEAAA